jgi:diguanylate cyclase (GGDEF)-like protein
MASKFAEQRQAGYRWLKFSGFDEQEFRQYYAEASSSRARLVMALALATVLVLIGVRFAEQGLGVMLAFQAFVMVPILSATLYMSRRPDQYRLYQFLLACGALLVGLVINSVVTRATLSDMPYYFSATIAWVFIVWLILGLTFRAAAVTAAAISLTYVWGLNFWSVQAPEAFFEMLMVGLVNVIGGYCCYQLEQAVRKNFVESKALNRLAEQDGLTGLYNRRSFDEHLERLWRQSRREETQLTLMLADIDHFKAFNDQYGHQAGDDALKRVAEVIGVAAQRPLDIAARYGGEEFALLLYGPVGDYARELTDQLRTDVLALKIPHKGSPTAPYMSVSIGIAIMMPNAERSMAGAVQMADEALYQAKEEGRNRVVVKESPNSTIQTGRFRASRKAG